MKTPIALSILLTLMLSLPAQSFLSENFNSGIPATWTIANGGSGADTWFGSTGGVRNNDFLDGTELVFVDSDAAPQTDTLSEMLISPVLNTTGANPLFLEFDHHFRVYSNDRGYLEVFNGTNWVVLDSFASSVGGFGNPDHAVYSLTSYANANLQVRFRYEDNGIWAWYWAVDNVEIYAPLSNDATVLSFDGPQTGCGLGSTEQVSLTYQNIGTNPITSLQLGYRLNGGTTVLETVSPNLQPGDTASYTFSTPANLSTPGVYNLDVFSVLAGDGNLLNDSLNGNQVEHYFPISSYPYFEDFEAGQGGWVSGGANSTWAFGTPAKDVIIGAASGVNAWVTGGLGTGNYANNENSWIQSPCMDLGSMVNPWVKFDLWWNIEWSWDGAILQSSTDLGNSWQKVGAFGDPNNWYTDNTINANPGGQQDGWSGRNSSNDGSGMWVTASHPVTNLAGAQDVLFRFVFATDGSVTDDGLAIDNFFLAEGPSVDLGPDSAFCDPVLLDAGAGYASYSWNGGDSTQTLLVDSSGVYSVTVVDSNGFSTSDTRTLVVYTLQDFDLGPADTSICGGGILVLDAGTSGNSYLWNTGATSNSITVDSSGLYYVAVAYGLSCLKSDQIEVTFAELEAGYMLSDTQICRNLPVTFTDTTTDATMWFWDFGDGTTSVLQSPTHTYTSGGTFMVKLVVGAGDCRDSIIDFLPVVNCASSLDPLADDLLQVYPNPNQGRFEVVLPENISGDWRMNLIDPQGRQVWRSTALSGNRQRVEVQSLAAGLYYLQVETARGTFRRKVILK